MYYGSKDYIRCGGALFYVTWPRIACLGFCTLITLLVLLSVTGVPPSKLQVASGPEGALPAYARKGESGIAKRSKRELKTGIMDHFCEARGSLYYLDKWRLASLGAPGYATAADSANLCDVKQQTTTQVPFAMCTFDRNTDTQVSAFIHKEGAWNPGKRDTFQRIMPIVGTKDDPFPSRTLFIDVGANIGFYTLLAATRGYDVIAIEPAKESANRLLLSLDLNGIKTAAKGKVDGTRGRRPLNPNIAAATSRDPVVHVYQNAGSDSYNSMNLHWVEDNPGACWVEPNGPGEQVTTVFLDDLLDPRSRDPSAGAPPPADSAPTIDPSRVRAIKISAEGMDSRVLHGARRLLSLGRIPYVHFVYNKDHITTNGCKAQDLILALFDYGYRLYYAGVYIYRDEELQRFLKGMVQRSSELLFVGPDVPLD